MYLAYGTYSHSQGETAIQITRTPEYNEAAQAWAYRERWDVQGLLTNNSGSLADMQTAIAALEAAYASDGYDLVLHLPDGTATNHAMRTAGAIGGTRIVQPVSYPEGSGPEGVTYRSYSLAVEGLFLTGVGTLLSWVESISFSGGGPVYGHIETLKGLPVKQKLRSASVYRAIQQGEAVGISAYPSVPAAIWPTAQVRTGGIRRQSPRRQGSSYIEFPVSWNYEFESAYPLVGNPTRW